MDVLIKTAGACLAASVLALLIKKDTPAISLAIGCAAACLAVYLANAQIKETVSFVNEVSELSGIAAPTVSALLKGLAAAIVTKLTADICKDSGMSAAASSVELVGSLTVFAVSLPVIRTMLNMIRGLL